MSRRILIAVMVFASAGCTSGPDKTTVASGLPAQAHGVVLAAEGAGNLGRLPAALRQALGESHILLEVKPVAWSHGNGRIFADQMDFAHTQAEGRRLATTITASRQARPLDQIYLVGYSAGCAVALAAAEELPPGSVDGIVLLAPSVSAHYDLRPALACCPIDVFYSTEDWFFLGVGVALLGTTDRDQLPAAGRTGFLTTVTSPQDKARYARLHQHPWIADDEHTGHRGGHFGGTQSAFLRTQVIPLLVVK
ncbi:MAG: alpha/beta fold hydrolase [Gemmataceae bacterium]